MSDSCNESTNHSIQSQWKQPLPQEIVSLQSALNLNSIIKHRVRFQNDPLKSSNHSPTYSLFTNKRRFQRRNSKCPSMLMAAVTSACQLDGPKKEKEPQHTSACQLDGPKKEKEPQQSLEEDQYQPAPKRRRFQRRNSKCPSMFKISDFAPSFEADENIHLFTSSTDDDEDSSLFAARELVTQLKLRRQR